MANRRLLIALYVNAAAVAGLLLYLVFSNQSVMPAAYGQLSRPAVAPDVSGDGLSLVPVQMSTNTWGCYLLDAKAQVICVYQYVPGERLLRLQAARNIAYDRKLGAFNTAPLPREVADLVARESGGAGSTQAPLPEPTTRESAK